MFVLLIYNKGGCKMFIIKGGDNNELFDLVHRYAS